MNRRKMIKMSAGASLPLVFNFPFKAILPGSEHGPGRSPARFGDGRDWFFEKRYGMFVHWGLYALPAWHEQIQWRKRIPRKDYVKLAREWNPAKFSASQWLDILQEAGMEYLTFTTKHHDGFCLWDTKYTKFNVMNTPYKRDILRLLSDECHKRKIPLCLYYSIVDWNHKNYPNQNRHHELKRPETGDAPDWDKYFLFVKNQVKELCSNYGEIHGFWWDINVPEYKDRSVNDMIRKLQPKAVINDRGFDEGDFSTPEREDGSKEHSKRPTEACQSVDSLSWGYRNDPEFYSDHYLVKSMDRYFSGGSNFLLNVGPDKNGVITDEYADILKRISPWYASVKESYKDVTAAPDMLEKKSVTVTRRKNTLYIHFNGEPESQGFSLKPITQLPKSAVLLNDGRNLNTVITYTPNEFIEAKGYLRLNHLPVNEMAGKVMVVKMEFDNL